MAVATPVMSGANYPCLQDRVVIVTGGASGIGAAMVEAFVRQGARVAFLDRDVDAGLALGDRLDAEAGVRPLFVACDLLDISALQRHLEQVADRLGLASVLINNAASDQRHDFAELKVEEFDLMMGVNLRHVMFAAQAVLPQMRRLGAGSIINLTSVAWMRGVASLQVYSAAKAAIVGFTNSLAREVGRDRIRVNAIAPGLVLTPRQRAAWFRDEGNIAAATSTQMLPDAIEPVDIARLTLFLASDESRMITKQCIAVNAGSF